MSSLLCLLLKCSLPTAAIVLTVAAAFARLQPTAPTTQPTPLAKHVLIIGLDGARADALRDHAGPAIQSLINAGAVCWKAQAVKPSVTQVNWPSILTGCTPGTHGIAKHPITEAELAAMSLKVPTLFQLVARAGQTSAGFLGHWKLYSADTTEPGTHVIHSPYEAKRVAPLAAEYTAKEKPTFTFVYFGDLDGLGHRTGWMSPEYLAGIAEIDRGVATLLDALDKSGQRDQTVILITSDHGGHGKSHGDGSPEDLQIPWIAAGPGIRPGTIIDRTISTTDTAPTVLRLLGITTNTPMDGKVVTEALETEK